MRFKFNKPKLFLKTVIVLSFITASCSEDAVLPINPSSKIHQEVQQVDPEDPGPPPPVALKNDPTDPSEPEPPLPPSMQSDPENPDGPQPPVSTN